MQNFSLEKARNIAVAGLVVFTVLLVSTIGTTNAQTINDEVINGISNGDVIALIGSGDIYVVVIEDIEGATQTKRQFMNPQAFEAYTLRSWDDVIYVSQEVFDSYTTTTALSSVTGVQAFTSAIRTAVAPPGAQTPPPPAGTGASTPTPTPTPTTTIYNGDVIALIGSGDIYVVNIEGATTTKQHIANPEVFNAYALRSWNNVKYVSQEVFDSFTTTTPVSSTGQAQELVRTIQNAPTVALTTPGQPTQPATPGTPSTQPTLPTHPEDPTQPTPPTQQGSGSSGSGSSGGGGGFIAVVQDRRLSVPENLTAVIPDHATITDPIVIKDPSNAIVQWRGTDNSANAYEVQWCTDSCRTDRDWDGKAIVRGRSTTSYRILANKNWADGIFADRANAKIRVRAIKTGSNSRKSRWVETNIQHLVTLDPVSNLRIKQADSSGRNRFNVEWDAIPNTANVFYDIFYYKAGTDWYTTLWQNPQEDQNEDLTRRAWHAYYYRGSGNAPCVNDGHKGANSERIADNNNLFNKQGVQTGRQKTIIVVCHQATPNPEAFLNSFGNWNTTYLVWVRQRQTDNSAFSPFTKPIKIATTRFVITSPSNTENSITLEWNKTVDSPNGNRVLNRNPSRTIKYVDTYDVEYCDVSTGCDDPSEWTPSTATIRTKAGDRTKAQITIGGLTRSTNYKVRIRPTFAPTDEIAEVYTKWTDYFTARTADSVTLNALQNLQVKNTGGWSGRGAALIGWDAPTEASPGFEVRYKKEEDSSWVSSDMQTLATVTSATNPTQSNPSCQNYNKLWKGEEWNKGAGAKNGFICPAGNEALLTDLSSSNALYELQARHFTGAGGTAEYSPWETVKLATLKIESPTARESTTLTFEWGKFAGTTQPTGYEVQWCTGATCRADQDGDWTTSAGTTEDHGTDDKKKTHTITGLTKSTTYKVRIKPTFADANIVTNWFERGGIRTDDSITLTALSNFNIKENPRGRDVVLVGWDAPSEASPTFEIRYRKGSSGGWITRDIQTLATKTSADTPTASDPSCKNEYNSRRGGNLNTGAGAKNAFLCPTGNEALFVALSEQGTLYELEVRHFTGAGATLEYSPWQTIKMVSSRHATLTHTSTTITAKWNKNIVGATPTDWEVGYCRVLTQGGTCSNWSVSSAPTPDDTTDSTKKTHTISNTQATAAGYRVRTRPTFAEPNILGQWNYEWRATN